MLSPGRKARVASLKTPGR